MGEIPKALTGVYLRNPKNRVPTRWGRFHPSAAAGLRHVTPFHNARPPTRTPSTRTLVFPAEKEPGPPLTV